VTAQLLLAAAAAALLAAPAAARPARSDPLPAPAAQEVRIPFADFHGIRSFHADDDRIVYLQDYRRNWYRAELNGPCFGLPWARRIGVDNRGSSTFDRFSILIVGDERCMIGSLSRSEGPPRRAARRHRAR